MKRKDPSTGLMKLIDQYNNYADKNTRKANSEKIRAIYTLAEEEGVEVLYLLKNTFTVRRVYQVMNQYRKMGHTLEEDREREREEFTNRYNSCK